jgi:apolipoprotein N-acyltransferase
MSVFRAVETGRSVVRATTSGVTAAIDPNGAIIAQAPAFIETTLIARAPLATRETLYTRVGDALPIIALALAALGLILGGVNHILKPVKA